MDTDDLIVQGAGGKQDDDRYVLSQKVSERVSLDLYMMSGTCCIK